MGGAVPRASWTGPAVEVDGARARLVVLSGTHGSESKQSTVPLLLLEPANKPAQGTSGVLVVTRAGKQDFVRQRADAIARLLDSGISVALPDVYSSGLTGTGMDRSRRSSSTGRASTLAMFGLHLSDLQSRDIYQALQWLQAQQGWDGKQVGLWSDSLVPPSSADVKFQVPRDDDSRLPPGPDPLPQIATLQFNRLVKAIYIRGGLSSAQSVLQQHLVLLPEDSIPLPGDFRESFTRFAISHQRNAALREDQTVDALNREVPAEGKPEDHDPQTAAAWLISQLKPKAK